MNRSNLGRRHLPFLARGVLVLLMACFLVGAKKKESDAADPTKTAALAASVALPADLNIASLRVAALDTIYQLDLSAAQLHLLKTAAVGNVNAAQRTPAKADPKLMSSLSELAAALLDGKDDTHIADLRNQVVELSNGDSVQLDDEIQPTAKPKKPHPN